MVERQELLRIWWCRIWRRRWFCLGVTWAMCAPGWILAGLLTGQHPVVAGLLLGLVLLAGGAGGIAAAVLVAGRAPVFDSVAELQRSCRLPVLGSVPDLTPGAWQRASPHLAFALGCLGLIATFTGLLVASALGILPGP